MKNLLIYLCTVMILSPTVGHAQSTAFDAIVDEIMANNPTLMSRRASMDAQVFAMKAENNLSDPEVEFEHQWGQKNVGNKWNISITQSFDWPGVYASRSKASSAGAEAFRLLYLADEADMRLRISTNLVEYIAAQMQLELSEQISSNITSISENITNAYEHGEATVLDYRKIHFEKISAEASTDAARTLSDNLRQELIALNGGKTIDLNRLVDLPSIALKSEDYYYEKHRTSNPALLAQDYLCEAAGHNVSVASRLSLPSMSLGYIHNVEIGDHFNGVKLGVSLPFFSNRHRKAQAIAEAEAAQSNRLMAELEVNRKVISDYISAKYFDERLQQYSVLFPSNDDADSYLVLLCKSYDGGQMTLINYLYEINFYIEARAAYINLLRDRTVTALSLSRFD